MRSRSRYRGISSSMIKLIGVGRCGNGKCRNVLPRYAIVWRGRAWQTAGAVGLIQIWVEVHVCLFSGIF